MVLAAQLFSARAFLRNRISIRRAAAAPKLSLGLVVLGLLTLCDGSSAQARKMKYAALSEAPVSTCAVHCDVSHGGLSCPGFFTAQYRYPCTSHKMQQTACGWQLKRTFMCW